MLLDQFRLRVRICEIVLSQLVVGQSRFKRTHTKILSRQISYLKILHLQRLVAWRRTDSGNGYIWECDGCESTEAYYLHTQFICQKTNYYQDEILKKEESSQENDMSTCLDLCKKPPRTCKSWLGQSARKSKRVGANNMEYVTSELEWTLIWDKWVEKRLMASLKG